MSTLAEYDRTLFNVTLGVTVVGFVLLLIGQVEPAFGFSIIGIVAAVATLQAIRALSGNLNNILTDMDRIARISLLLVGFVVGVALVSLFTASEVIESLTRVFLASATGAIVIASRFYREQDQPDEALTAEQLDETNWEE